MTPEGSSARMVGVRLAELGDQIDAMYGDELDEIVQLAGSPDEAFSSFSTVVRSVFDWDENGIREWLIDCLQQLLVMSILFILSCASDV